MKTALAVTLALLLAAQAAAADTYYLVDLGKHAFMIPASTIRDIGPGRKAADAYEVGFLDAELSKFEVDCGAREARVVARSQYLLQSEVLKQTGTTEGTGWLALQHNPQIERIYNFICYWPKVDPDVESADFADDAAMVTSLSESILDMPAR